MKSSLSILFAACLLSIFGAVAHGGVLINDQFDRGSTASLKALNGATPGKSALGAIKWIADKWVTDGESAIIEDAASQSAFLPFSPRPGKIYELSAIITVAAPSDGTNDWIGLGFSQGKNPALQIFANSQSRNGIMVRPAGTIHSFYEGKSTMLYADVEGGEKLAVVLDTRGEQWTISWKINDRQFGKPHTLSNKPKINYIGFGNLKNAAGTVKNITLQEK